jgi:hypothetical protein
MAGPGGDLEPDLRAVPEVLLGAGERVLDGSLGRLR